jgi:hypothetical protein
LCITSLTATGYEGMNFGAESLLEAGVLNYDPTKAAACLADINAIDCTSNVITSAQQLAILSDCVGAIYGTLAANASCTRAIECGSGLFCDTPDDGGPGTCAPLRGDGGACGNFGGIPTTFDYGLGEEACSFRRSGNTGLFCYERDLTTGMDIDGATGSWVCVPAGAVGTGCNVDQECASALCDPGPPGFGYTYPDGAVTFGSVYQCANSRPFTYLNTCLPFAQ